MTERSRRVVIDAQAVARRLRHDSIDAPHVLLGILASDSTGAEALNEAGLYYDAVLSSVQPMYEQRCEEPQLPFGTDAKKLLELSVREAITNKQTFIEPAHFALACSHGDQLPSIEPFVGGRELVIRDAALRALRRSAPVDEQRERRAPTRSPDQRLDALMRANQIRVRRAQLKRDLKAGHASIRALLLDSPDYIQTAKVFDVLLALPGFGRVRVYELLTRCRISPNKTIGGLSRRQREQLVSLLDLAT